MAGATDPSAAQPLRRLDADEAAATVVAAMTPRAATTLPLHDARGSALAADLIAPFALPPWTNASMDGYAVRAADIRGASAASPRRLRVMGEVRAGGGVPVEIGAGEAVRIFTGAEVPGSADSVVRQEDVERAGDVISVRNDRDAKANVRGAGLDVAAGSVALTAGTILGPGQLGLLAGLGITNPIVFPRPRVGILVTGDEIVAADNQADIQSGRRLADVNTPMLSALVECAGGVAIPLGIAPDDPNEIRKRIADAPDLDLLITVGGVSVGDHDHLPAVMQALNVKFAFRRVRVRPGGPTSFGVLPSGLPWLGLPGNPVSALVTFTLFGAPAVRALMGAARPVATRFAVVAAENFSRDVVLELYLRVKIDPAQPGEIPRARLTGAQGSGVLSSVALADALVRVPSGDGQVKAGDVLEAIAL